MIRGSHLALNIELTSDVVEPIVSHKSWGVLVETTTNDFERGVRLNQFKEVFQVFVGDGLRIHEEKL